MSKKFSGNLRKLLVIYNILYLLLFVAAASKVMDSSTLTNFSILTPTIRHYAVVNANIQLSDPEKCIQRLS